MKALAKYEMLDSVPGMKSIELIQITDVHSVVIIKFDTKESAEQSKSMYIDKMKQNPNIKIQSFEGHREFIQEK